MSPLKPIAYPEEFQHRVAAPSKLWMVAFGVGLGLLLGYVASSIAFATAPADATRAPANVLTPEQFFELNTEGFLLPAPIDSGPAAFVDRFFELNVGSYDDLLQMRAQRYAVDPDFVKINTTGLDFPAASSIEPWSGPR